MCSSDLEGFLTITDRLSRFTKIGGEMIPHGKVEEIIRGILGHENCAVTGIPDEKRGERLAVLYVDELPPSDLAKRLNEAELPNLWIPKTENLYRVAELPVLATGKLDLRRLKALAAELAQ